MKKIVIATLFLTLGLYAAAPSAHAEMSSGDSVVDKAGDWFATMGKDKSEKEMILAQRRTARATRKMEKMMKREGKKAEKETKKMGKEMEELF